METFQKIDDNEGDAILIAFLEAGPGARLTEWMRRYPAHARDLARLAADRWVGEREAAPDAAAEARVREIGLSVFRAARREVSEPLNSLKAAAQVRGWEPDAVAARLGLPAAYFWKLHRRLFTPESVPRALVAALAETLGRTVEDVAAYLRRPPILAAGASYRADTAPRAGEREDFRAALRADPDLTEDARARWLGPGEA